MTDPRYWYDAVVARVVDGDTVYFDVDLGFTVHYSIDVRLLDIDAPEVYGAHATEAGRQAKAYMESLCPPGQAVLLHTQRDDTGKYGRYLATVYLPGDDVSLNQKMIDSGHAVPYDGS